MKSRFAKKTSPIVKKGAVGSLVLALLALPLHLNIDYGDFKMEFKSVSYVHNVIGSVTSLQRRHFLRES